MLKYYPLPFSSLGDSFGWYPLKEFYEIHKVFITKQCIVFFYSPFIANEGEEERLVLCRLRHSPYF